MRNPKLYQGHSLARPPPRSRRAATGTSCTPPTSTCRRKPTVGNSASPIRSIPGTSTCKSSAGVEPEQRARRAPSSCVQLVLSDRSELTKGQDFGVIGVKSWRLADLGAKHALLLAGVGWGNMPEPMVREDLAAERLKQLALPEWSGGLYSRHPSHGQSAGTCRRLDHSPLSRPGRRRPNRRGRSLTERGDESAGWDALIEPPRSCRGRMRLGSGSHAVAVLLARMGQDGAEGMPRVALRITNAVRAVRG
jgi:hypothetical protein